MIEWTTQKFWIWSTLFFTHDSKGSIVDFWFLKFLPPIFLSILFHILIYIKKSFVRRHEIRNSLSVCVSKKSDTSLNPPHFTFCHLTWARRWKSHTIMQDACHLGDDKWESENIIFSFFILSWNNTTFDYAENLSVRGINNSNWDVWH